MSAPAHSPVLSPASGRLPVRALVAEPASLVAVAAGGLTLGFFFWYGLISRYHEGGTITEATFLLSEAVGVAVALWAWRGYSGYFARRAEISLAVALRYDAVSWASLVAAWLTFLLPGAGSTGRSVALAGALFCLIKLIAAIRFNRTVRDVATTFAVTRVAIILIAELAAIVIAQRSGTHVAVSSFPALSVWARWDAVHYLNIASQGYYGTEMAFFPLYPVLVAILGGLTGNHLLAGLFISNLALFFGLLFFYKLVEHQYNRHVAQRAIFYVSIFPTAIFFSAVYTESLFFALTVASFYYIRERRWVLAGIVGFFAALTRVEGVLLTVPFAIEWFVAVRQASLPDLVRWPQERLIRPAVGLALIPLGLATYMAYLWVLRGDPLYFSHVQVHWGRHFAMPWVSVTRSVYAVIFTHSPLILVEQALELAFTALMVGVLLFGFRRLRPSYTAYMALSILVPMSTSSLMSMPRFALVLFPMFVVLALWGERHPVNNAIVAFSLPLLGLFTVLFANWYWVA